MTELARGHAGLTRHQTSRFLTKIVEPDRSEALTARRNSWLHVRLSGLIVVLLKHVFAASRARREAVADQTIQRPNRTD
jgi:hypothetical protein